MRVRNIVHRIYDEILLSFYNRYFFGLQARFQARFTEIHETQVGRECNSTRSPVTHLKSDVVAETYGRECHEAVVETVEVTPALVSREHRSARRDDYAREQTGCQHEIHFRGLGLLASEVSLGASDHDRRELVQPLTDALEHHQAQRDSHHRVRHAERLPAYGHRGGMPITLKKDTCTIEIQLRYNRASRKSPNVDTN